MPEEDIEEEIAHKRIEVYRSMDILKVKSF